MPSSGPSQRRMRSCGQELPALQQWSFTREDAIRITQPALAVLGENTAPTFRERRELLLSWLPNVEPLDLPAATHLLHVQNPDGMAGHSSSSSPGIQSRLTGRLLTLQRRDRGFLS